MEDKVTQYHDETPQEVKDILERYRNSDMRIRLFLGDGKTGEDWNEENDVQGYIGRSMGTKPIPILLPNKNSIAGGHILDHCIVKITLNKHTLYQHPKYHNHKFTQNGKEVFRDGKAQASFDNESKAGKYIQFMMGERNNWWS